MSERYLARSASDKTDDWPHWFVADQRQGGLNVTVKLLPQISGYLPLLPKDLAVMLAKAANAEFKKDERMNVAFVFRITDNDEEVMEKEVSQE